MCEGFADVAEWGTLALGLSICASMLLMFLLGMGESRKPGCR